MFQISYNRFTLILTFIYIVLGICFGIKAQAKIPDGTWQKDCLRGEVKTLVVSNQIYSKTVERFFSDPNCSTEIIEFTTEGILFFPSQLAVSDDINLQVDFSYSSVSLTLLSKEIINDFNSRKVCGKENWAYLEPQNITGLKCALFSSVNEILVPKSGSKLFGIYKIVDNQLFFGQLTSQFDSSSQEKRPQYFESTGYQLLR